MKKRKKGRRLKRNKGQRRALLRSLSTELFLKEKIRTTKAKAKEVKSFAEKAISKAKKDDLASRRQLLRHFSPRVVKKLIDEIGPRFKERPGGYARIIKLFPRKTDGAEMVIIELVK